MSPFLLPLGLFVAFLVVLAMWQVWHLASGRTAPGRVARGSSVIVTLIAIAFAGRLLVAPLPSERTLTWKMGFGYDPTSADLVIEVERPPCAPNGNAWIAPPVVTSTPLAVFITVRMADSFNVPGCTGTLGYNPGGLRFDRLPMVGGYLTGSPLVVHVGVPVGLRAVLDGSGLIPEPRLPIR